MAKEISNNVLALVVIGVMVLSIVSTSLVWFSVNDDVAPITGAVTGGGDAQVGLEIAPYNEDRAQGVINGETEVK
tara:strand:+ start:374 stop:598 length:225 start_codon:yes stop_codon:yes gene_type:complete